jgi:SAM-dependent methyltransferase
MTELYRKPGLTVYEKSHYSHMEHIHEVNQILTWYRERDTNVLDIGCSGGLHALEFAKRGFSVTGLDIEPSAIEIARKRKHNENIKARFYVIDIENDELSGLGKFNFIYSIGNVLSHVNQEHFLEILQKIQGCLDNKGIFLFDILMNEPPFQEEIYPGDNDLQIVWKRKIDEKTGRMSMDGTFLESGFKQHFDVWGYKIDEVIGILNAMGFRIIDFSEKLDFIEKNKTKNPISLYFRVKLEG